MHIEDYPSLLVLAKLIRPIDLSIDNLRKSESHLHADLEEIFVHGVFVLSVSSVEVMISDILRYFLVHFPQKLPISEFKYDKDVFFENSFNLLSKTVENYLHKLSYKSFDEYFNTFLECLSIEWEDFHESLGKDFQEIKATRNLLLHNNLTVNDSYLECAGSAARTSVKGRKIRIDYQYTAQSIATILSFQERLKKHVADKYAEYTKVNANKKLWGYMFTSPVMPYDDYWYYDETKDHISAFKKGVHESQLSSSETALLGLWRNHFTSGDGSSMKQFNMKLLDRANKEKVMFFLSIAGEFSFE